MDGEREVGRERVVEREKGEWREYFVNLSSSRMVLAWTCYVCLN